MRCKSSIRTETDAVAFLFSEKVTSCSNQDLIAEFCDFYGIDQFFVWQRQQKKFEETR